MWYIILVRSTNSVIRNKLYLYRSWFLKIFFQDYKSVLYLLVRQFVLMTGYQKRMLSFQQHDHFCLEQNSETIHQSVDDCSNFKSSKVASQRNGQDSWNKEKQCKKYHDDRWRPWFSVLPMCKKSEIFSNQDCWHAAWH